MSSLKQQTIFGFFWRFLQNAGTQVIGFIVSIILARILMPSDYGLIAMITVFTSIASVFVTTGFSSSIIQKKDLSDIDKSTIFHTGIATSLFLYIGLFFLSPYIANFYRETQLVALIRVQSLSLILSALYSTHSAILSRELRFKKSFIASLSGVCVQGVLGISLAYIGFGPWALVYSYLANSAVCTVVTWIIVKWMPKMQFSMQSFKQMFAFSIKILCLSLVNTLFYNIQALVIARQYSSQDLAYYNRGQQFPSLIMQQVDGSMNTVLFSSLAKYQDDWDSGLRVLRHAMRTSMYICFPLMIGLFAAAEPLVRFLLTDKWIDSVPFVRLMAVICLFWPLSAQKNALNALGKSGIPLAMNICSQIITLILILLTYKISVIAMVSSTLVSSIIFQGIGAFIYRKYLNYGICDQIWDMVPSLFAAVFMGCIVFTMTFLNIDAGLILLLQMLLGVIVYGLISHIFKIKAYVYILNMIKPRLLKLILSNR